LKNYVLEVTELDHLIEILHHRGYTVIGPTICDSAIIYDEVKNSNDFPRGWTDEQTNGTYRLKRRNDNALFGWTVGPQSWKKFLFPPIQKLFTTHKSAKGLDLPNVTKPTSKELAPQKYAFLGVRPCELNAIALQDKVFLGGPFIDPFYEQKRTGTIIIAINCGQAGGTCFCVSMKTGPRAVAGFDLALTEVLNEVHHYFLVEVGTDAGADILKEIRCTNATDEDIARAQEISAKTALHMGRSIDTTDLKTLLYQNVDHPRWERTAARCLTCTNCTMVCPTCFCATVEDMTDLAGTQAERMRKWDSCFTLDFSYIHGGSVRASVKSRYRQWMMHKLASWVDQFGSFGCVGCGRCITWCPVGIDITEEARAIRENQS